MARARRRRRRRSGTEGPKPRPHVGSTVRGGIEFRLLPDNRVESAVFGLLQELPGEGNPDAGPARDSCRERGHFVVETLVLEHAGDETDAKCRAYIRPAAAVSPSFCWTSKIEV